MKQILSSGLKKKIFKQHDYYDKYNGNWYRLFGVVFRKRVNEFNRLDRHGQHQPSQKFSMVYEQLHELG